MQLVKTNKILHFRGKLPTSTSCYSFADNDISLIKLLIKYSPRALTHRRTSKMKREQMNCVDKRLNQARRIKFLSLLCDQNSLVIKIAIEAARYLGQVCQQDFAPQI